MYAYEYLSICVFPKVLGELFKKVSGFYVSLSDMVS